MSKCPSMALHQTPLLASVNETSRRLASSRCPLWAYAAILHPIEHLFDFLKIPIRANMAFLVCSGIASNACLASCTGLTEYALKRVLLYLKAEQMRPEQGMEESKLRRVVFERFRCYPGHLERIISKNLGCRVRFKGLLGCGSSNVVVEATLLDRSQQKQEQYQCRRVALRLQQRQGKPMASTTPTTAISGYAATLFLSTLDLPVLVAGPVHVADPSLPYAPPGKSQFTVTDVVKGVEQACKRFRTATLEWKKTLLADLAKVPLQLYRHPFSALGAMALSSDGRPCVGPMTSSPVYLAKQRGIHVGKLSAGPYSSWKDYARNQVEGYKLLFSNSVEHPWYAESLECSCELLLSWLDKYEEDGGDQKAFYLYHPEFADYQLLVDSCSGHLKCIIDWDGARTGSFESLVSGFYLPGHMNYYDYEDEDEPEMFEFYCQQLIQGGVPSELVGRHVRRRWHGKRCDPREVFESTFGDFEIGNIGDLCYAVYFLCKNLQKLGVIDPAEKLIAPRERPWITVQTSAKESDSSVFSSSQEEDHSSSTSSSSEGGAAD